MTSCADCLAWGQTYAQGVCLACYNFAAARFGQHVGECGACRRRVRLKKGYCRLCWCQAREDRAVAAEDARAKAVLAPFVATVRFHQLFLADLYRPRARPRTADRRRGAKGRPVKPPPPVALRPRPDGAQLVLFANLPRTYRYGSVDLRSGSAPDNPWLAWALHLAHTMAETRGFDPIVRRTLNRNLVMLLAAHADGDTVRVSDFQHVIRNRGGGLIHILDVLATMGILHDDRPSVFDTWLESKLDNLAPAIAHHVQRWAHVLRDGGPRHRPRRPETAMTYLNAARPALQTWSGTYDHLREVTRDDVVAHLDLLRGESRMHALVALRSLFTWAKREAVIFRNPASRIRVGKHTPPVWQRLSEEDIAAAAQAASTPQARLCVTLALVHAARPGQIRALQLDDVDLANRRLTVASRVRPLDELTYRMLIEWLGHRRRRWPHTANAHLLISKESALRLGPVSAAFILNLRGLPANLERLRIDRQLEEALACGADPLHLSAVFGMAEQTAIRYATNARQLLEDVHAATPSGSLRTPVSNPDNEADDHLGSR
ncbi:integrase [Lentzea sp. HUAS12]|uniref:integrase n=1 Tax=Lentzea sp. HUAS12 TaxID=2951806 RepID=UPI00209E8C70|nr:integrase [Lentzea sp. HUAS12]USX56404.1 integrase [Lentzea sp. HUAS12]